MIIIERLLTVSYFCMFQPASSWRSSASYEIEVLLPQVKVLQAQADVVLNLLFT